MNDKDLKDAITIIRVDKNSKKPTEPVRYNSTGEDDSKRKKKFLDDETAAMQVPTSTGQLYRVKIERSGKFFNPIKITNSYNLDQLDRLTKDLRFQFKTVSERAFNHYVSFLMNKHDSSLLAAEREVR